MSGWIKNYFFIFISALKIIEGLKEFSFHSTKLILSFVSSKARILLAFQLFTVLHPPLCMLLAPLELITFILRGKMRQSILDWIIKFHYFVRLLRILIWFLSLARLPAFMS